MEAPTVMLLSLFQEFMVMPVKADNFTHALKMGTEIFHNLKKVLKKKFKHRCW